MNKKEIEKTLRLLQEDAYANEATAFPEEAIIKMLLKLKTTTLESKTFEDLKLKSSLFRNRINICEQLISEENLQTFKAYLKYKGSIATETDTIMNLSKLRMQTPREVAAHTKRRESLRLISDINELTELEKLTKSKNKNHLRKSTDKDGPLSSGMRKLNIPIVHDQLHQSDASSE